MKNNFVVSLLLIILIIESIRSDLLLRQLSKNLTKSFEQIQLTVGQAADLQIRLRDLTNEVHTLKSHYAAAANLSVAVDLTKWTGGLRKVWEPELPPHGIIILHQGHSSFAGNDINGHRYPSLDLTPIAHKFLSEGYRVYGVEMPPLPHNQGPIEQYYKHVTELLDELGQSQLPIFMVGLSGGGWTTTVASALDNRIKKGFSIAGDVPKDVAPHIAGECYEQLNPPYDYRALYRKAGERLTHIYIYNEPSSRFSGIKGNIGYHYVNDNTTKLHTISDWTVEYILNTLEHLSRPKASEAK